MNAQTLPRSAQKEDYAPTVRCFIPRAEADELDVRCSLLLMRDLATSAKRHCCDGAWPLLDYVETAARDCAFAAWSTKELEDIRGGLRKVIAASAMLEAVFAPKLPLEGANAGA